MYTVKQLSDLAGVSIRTLHHYDDIDLLKPARIGDNGYRYYDDVALLRHGGRAAQERSDDQCGGDGADSHEYLQRAELA